MNGELFIFVEGNDDERFFRRIFLQKFRQQYREVRLIPYAQRRWSRLDNTLRATAEMRKEYIFVADYDSGPSYSARKAELCQHYKSLEPQRIALVRREIEGWYLAGLDVRMARQWRIRHRGNTDDLTKEQFNLMIPPEFFPRMVFMRAILDHYSLKRGIAHNHSLAYFCAKYRIST